MGEMRATISADKVVALKDLLDEMQFFSRPHFSVSTRDVAMVSFAVALDGQTHSIIQDLTRDAPLAVYNLAEKMDELVDIERWVGEPLLELEALQARCSS